MKNLLNSIVFFLLIPCAVFAQVVPAEQEDVLAEEVERNEPLHHIDYFSTNAWVLLGFGWRYSLDGDTVTTTKEINNILDQNEYSSGYLTKSKVMGYSAATLAIGGLAFMLSVALTAPLWIDTDRESTPEWVTKTGNAIIASIPLDWLLLYESNRYYQMSINSYTLGRDVMAGNQKAIRTSKIFSGMYFFRNLDFSATSIACSRVSGSLSLPLFFSGRTDFSDIPSSAAYIISPRTK